MIYRYIIVELFRCQVTKTKMVLHLSIAIGISEHCDILLTFCLRPERNIGRLTLTRSVHCPDVAGV